MQISPIPLSAPLPFRAFHHLTALWESGQMHARDRSTHLFSPRLPGHMRLSSQPWRCTVLCTDTPQNGAHRLDDSRFTDCLRRSRFIHAAALCEAGLCGRCKGVIEWGSDYISGLSVDCIWAAATALVLITNLRSILWQQRCVSFCAEKDSVHSRFPLNALSVSVCCSIYIMNCVQLRLSLCVPCSCQPTPVNKSWASAVLE